MRNSTSLPVVFAALLSLAAAGCGTGASVSDGDGERTGSAKEGSATDKPIPAGDWKRKELGKGVWLETAGERRRVRVDAAVCLREGEYGLECLLCREYRKEHESILKTAANAQVIHAGLLACGAEPGHPVRFGAEVQSPTGTPIKVTLEYEDQGKLVTVPAKDWVQVQGTKESLKDDWVFAGSVLFPNPEGDDKPREYAATNEGGYIAVTNLPTAMLDLPIRSAKNPDERSFTFYTERIPPVGTKVSVLLEPAPGAKKPPKSGK
jgi:hypothetical protein